MAFKCRTLKVKVLSIWICRNIATNVGKLIGQEEAHRTGEL
jgi:hypothetical protein